MDRLEQPVWYIARLIIEAQTPLSIGTGSPDQVFDTVLVRDANGLPAIPGTSLAGVLRHLYQSEYGEKDCQNVFGFAGKEDQSPSRLFCSWGHLLNSQAQVQEGLQYDMDALKQDEIYAASLAQIQEPLFRDRVRIHHRGAATDQGKFDRSIIAAGHRFVVELRLWAGKEETEIWQNILSLFKHPGFRLGANTRSGLGRMSLIKAYGHRFDLTQPDEVNKLQNLSPDLDQYQGLEALEIAEPHHGWLNGVLELEAEDLWRIGQGDRPLSRSDHPADLLPKLEERIDWSSGRGKRVLQLALLPASSIKGALSHRMSFHYRRFAGEWSQASLQDVRPSALESLLGSAKEDEQGRAGKLYIDDIYLDISKQQIAYLMHNCIDRFTQGVRSGALFAEEAWFKNQSIRIPIQLDTRGLEDEQNLPLLKKSLKASIDDLCQGRLPIGSRTSTGLGSLKGRLTGQLADWLEA